MRQARLGIVCPNRPSHAWPAGILCPRRSVANVVLIIPFGGARQRKPAGRPSTEPSIHGRVPTASLRQSYQPIVPPAAACGGRVGGGTDTPELPPPNTGLPARSTVRPAPLLMPHSSHRSHPTHS